MNKRILFAPAVGATLLLTAIASGGARAQDAPTSGAAMSDGGIVVKVGDAPVAFDTAKPRMIGGRIMVPVRGVFEKLGGTVQWDPATKTVKGARASGDNRFQMQIDKTEAMVDDKTTTLDAPPTLEAGTTYVPLRFVSEALGATVNFDNATHTVSIKPSVDAPGGASAGSSDQTGAPSETITPSGAGNTPSAASANPPGPAGAATGTSTPERAPVASSPAVMTPAPPARRAPAVNPAADDTATNDGGFLRYLPWILGGLALAALAAFLLTRKPGGQVIAASKGGETNTTTTRRNDKN